MFAQDELKKLAERKRMLLLEAELHRGVISLEYEHLRARLATLQEARTRMSAGGPWLAVGGAAAGVLAVRHWRKLLRWTPVVVSAMRWLKKARSK